MEHHRMHLCTYSRDVSLLKLSADVSLDEGSLTNTAIADEHKFELWYFCGLHLVCPQISYDYNVILK